ncbi:MAG: glycosyltransferase [Candidatus Aenigmarchaeota archaeon]|nr:glycosyltransferase [Candidatus Aenigmarchaeota archaeon]
MKGLVSVIIPTFNSEKTLERCLESVKNQSYKNIEIIVVDKFSKDKTVEIARKYKVKLIQGFLNKPQARNEGIRLSRGEFIFLMDSDFILTKNLIEECVEKIKEKRCDAIFINEEFEENSFLKKCRNIEKKIYDGQEIIEAPRFYTRNIISGSFFDERIEGPDEYDFYFNLKNKGLKTCRIRNSKIILVENPLNIKKKFMHGKYFVIFKEKNKNSIINKQISFNYRVSLLLKSFKYSFFHGFGLLLIKYVEYMSFIFGILVGNFERRILKLNISVQENFDKLSKDYEKNMFYNSIGSKFVNKIEMEKIDEIINTFIKSKKNSKVLDIGAGNGRWSKYFLENKFDVYSLDVSSEMCKKLKRIKKLKVINDTIENYKKENYFDLIFSFRSLKYCYYIEKALYNIKLSLSEEGYSIIEMPNKGNIFYFISYKISPVFYHLSKRKKFIYQIITEPVYYKDFKEKIEMVGMKIEKTYKLFFFPHGLYSKINNEKILNIVYFFDKIFSKIFPRSWIFVVRKDE